MVTNLDRPTVSGRGPINTNTSNSNNSSPKPTDGDSPKFYISII